MADDLHSGYGSTPVPDPTVLTTAALTREIAALKEIVFTRLDGMDRAIIVFNENITRVPTEVDKQVAHLKALHDEKFKSIQVQFLERDVRAEQSSKDSKVAVDAALQAAKEAVGKSEVSTVKQIDQMKEMISEGNKSLDGKVTDVKERLTRLEGKSEGRVVADTGHQMTSSFVVSVMSVLIALAALVALLYQSSRH